MNHPYKPIKNHWDEIFIIRAGMRRLEFGEFESLEDAKVKCDKLNKQL